MTTDVTKSTATVTTAAIENPRVLNLIEQFNGFMKASAENILQLAKTVFIAKNDLTEGDDLNIFCNGVGLNPKGSTFRKLATIGEKGARFSEYEDRMPATWTTFYKLALLSDKEFDTVVKSPHFSPFMTAKTINEIVPRLQLKQLASKRKTQPKMSKPFTAVLDLSGKNEQQVAEIRTKIVALQRQYGFRLELSNDFDAIAKQQSDARPSRTPFQMEQPASA